MNMTHIKVHALTHKWTLRGFELHDMKNKKELELLPRSFLCLIM